MFPKEITPKDGSKALIREAEISDAKSLIDYVNVIDSETKFMSREPGEFKYTLEEEMEIISRCKKAENEAFLVAEIAGEIVSAVFLDSVEKQRGRHAVTMGISVKKEHWNKGLASEMMQASIDWAKSNGITRKINLTVQVNNEKAIALYKKFGFKEEGRITREALIDGEFFDAYWMGLEID